MHIYIYIYIYMYMYICNYTYICNIIIYFFFNFGHFDISDEGFGT